MTFEERIDDVIDNVASLGFDLRQLIAERNCDSTMCSWTAVRSRKR
jgi:hypothetical protein